MADDVKSLVVSAESKLKEVAPKWLSVERLTRLALAARSRNPLLAECSPESFLLFCMRCAETGLEPIGAGGAWPVPFKNRKNNTMEVQFIPDWRGLINLAKRTDQIKHAYGEVVGEHDVIEYQKGDDPKLSHYPNLHNAGDPIGVYCIVVLPDDSKHIEYMTHEDVEAIRNRSKAGSNGPWVTDWGQMAIKTVVKRALKPFAGSPQMQTAIELDNAATGLLLPEAKEPVTMPTARIEAPPEQTEPPANVATGNMTVVSFANVGSKSGKSAKGPWTRYSAQASDGLWYSTSSSSIGELLESTKGTDITVKFKQTDKGRDIEDIIEADPAAGEPPVVVVDDDDLPFS